MTRYDAQSKAPSRDNQSALFSSAAQILWEIVGNCGLAPSSISKKILLRILRTREVDVSETVWSLTVLIIPLIFPGRLLRFFFLLEVEGRVVLSNKIAFRQICCKSSGR